MEVLEHFHDIIQIDLRHTWINWFVLNVIVVLLLWDQWLAIFAVLLVSLFVLWLRRNHLLTLALLVFSFFKSLSFLFFKPDLLFFTKLIECFNEHLYILHGINSK